MDKALPEIIQKLDRAFAPHQVWSLVRPVSLIVDWDLIVGSRVNHENLTICIPHHTPTDAR